MAGCCASIRPACLGAAYNPLLEVRRGNGRCAMSRTSPISWSIPKARSKSATIGRRPRHSLLVGAILHVLYAERDKTLAGVANLPVRPAPHDRGDARGDDGTRPSGRGRVHPVIASSARELLNKSENERSGVLSTAMSFLGLYRDPVVAHVTRRCDWRITDLSEGPSPRRSTWSCRPRTSRAPSR
jgi:type IV secretion system protein VirD4